MGLVLEFTHDSNTGVWCVVNPYDLAVGISFLDAPSALANHIRYGYMDVVLGKENYPTMFAPFKFNEPPLGLTDRKCFSH